jgi:hypothetical protein
MVRGHTALLITNPQQLIKLLLTSPLRAVDGSEGGRATAAVTEQRYAAYAGNQPNQGDAEVVVDNARTWGAQ